MNIKKRLFIFAGYDPKNIIDNSIIIYIRELSQLGDVVFVMDNELTTTELEKITPFTLYATGVRHGEYDFGSYKRGYMWARDHGILKNYDWVYFANDSVYGPLYPLQPYLEAMEYEDTDAVGMNLNPKKKYTPHLQSWFFGISRKVATSEWFEAYITSIVKQPKKYYIIQMYEIGFTKLLRQNDIHFRYFFAWSSVLYNIKSKYKRGFPFIKKSCFHRKDGLLGRQVLYILSKVSNEMKEAIIDNAKHIHGNDYIDFFLTNNILKIIHRTMKYRLKKIFKRLFHMNTPTNHKTDFSSKKRLFIFAGYDPENTIDDYVVIYARELSEIGDVVFVMDNGVTTTELEKITPFTLFATGVRHGEYDFGSYKRGYIWARDHGILKNYDWVYFVNDSVYGPFFSLNTYLEKIELTGIDAVGMNYDPRKKFNPHIQSWFFGISQKVVVTEWFEEFITTIEEQPTKRDIIKRYEGGLTRLLRKHNQNFKTAYKYARVYIDLKNKYNQRFPFLKKNCFLRKDGVLGRQMLYVLNQVSPEMREAIINNAKRLNGDEYIDFFLTNSKLKIIYRTTKYRLKKIFKRWL